MEVKSREQLEELYSLLGLTFPTDGNVYSDFVIKSRFRARALELHPDKNRAVEEQFYRLTEAYNILRDRKQLEALHAQFSTETGSGLKPRGSSPDLDKVRHMAKLREMERSRSLLRKVARKKQKIQSKARVVEVFRTRSVERGCVVSADADDSSEDERIIALALDFLDRRAQAAAH